MTAVYFGTFVLEIQQRRLFSNQEPVHLGARAFDVLLALVAQAGELVTKSQLFEQVWPGLVVEENNLQVHVSSLRRALGAHTIATVAGRGYRFVAQIFTPHAQPSAEDPKKLEIGSFSALRRTVAVLPFLNVGGDAEQDYFSDGLAEDIISHLSRSPWLQVVARDSSFNYRNSNLGAQGIGQALGAGYVVLGSVRRAGDTVRMTAELVDVKTAKTLWSDRFDRPILDLFAVQDQISANVASTIEPVYLRREEQLSRQLSASDMQHWDMLMQARWHFWRSTQEHTQKAQELLTRALLIKPNDSPSLALMAFTHLAQVWGSWTADARASIAQANKLAMSAVRHDDTDPFAHFTLGTALSCTGQMGLAIAELERALVLYPQFAAAAGELGRLLVFAGRPEEAEEYVLQAIDASPHDQHMSLWVRTRALACFSLGAHERALRYATLATSQRPDWFFNHFLLAAVQAVSGNLEAGRASMQYALALGPYSKQAMRVGHPFVHAADMQRFENALTTAGWQA